MTSKSQESCPRTSSSGVTGIWPSLGIVGEDSTSRPREQKRTEVPVSLCPSVAGDVGMYGPLLKQRVPSKGPQGKPKTACNSRDLTLPWPQTGVHRRHTGTQSWRGAAAVAGATTSPARARGRCGPRARPGSRAGPAASSPGFSAPAPQCSHQRCAPLLSHWLHPARPFGSVSPLKGCRAQVVRVNYSPPPSCANETPPDCLGGSLVYS